MPDGSLEAHTLITPPIIRSAAAIYLFGYLLRSLRLALLIGGWRVGLRDLSFHFFTASVSLAVPLKLGELYRLANYPSCWEMPVRATATVLWECIFDVVSIIAMMS